VTEQEARQFFNVAFAAFPGVSEWAKEKSSDFSLTIASWKKALATTTLEEAIEVIEGWSAGTIPDPPIGYKRESFALQVKAIAGQRRFEKAKEQRREEEWVKANRSKYQRPAGLVLLSPYLNRIFEKQAEFRNGNITQAELDAQTNAIVEEFGSDTKGLVECK
jgi:CRISPR/Cas system Type II protein with McrA/HNH and RuvC-like nuclease domain